MKKLPILLLATGLFMATHVCYADCPAIVSEAQLLAEGYNLQIFNDSDGNGLLGFTTNLSQDSIVTRIIYFDWATKTYSFPVIISDPNTRSTQLSIAVSQVLGTAIALWVEDDHVVARSKPAPMNVDNWATQVTLSGLNADQPHAFMNVQGDAFVAYRGDNGLGSKTIEFRRKLAAGAWEAPVLLATGATIEEPRIAANLAGDVCVVWKESGQVWGRRKPALAAWEATIQLSFGTAAPIDHSVVVGTRGSIITLYSQDSTSYSRFKWYNAALWSNVVPVGSGVSNAVHLAIDPVTDNALAVKGNHAINAVAWFSDVGAWASAQQRMLNTNNQGAEPFVDVNGQDHFVSIWSSLDDSGVQLRLYTGELCDINQVYDGAASGATLCFNNIERALYGFIVPDIEPA